MFLKFSLNLYRYLCYNINTEGEKKLKYLYLYIENEKVNDVIKYGMKLSEHANKILKINNEKKGIISYLTPKDSNLYNDTNFTCLKINTDNLHIYIYNKIFEDTDYLKKYFIENDKYEIGSFEEPIALICSTILPENITLYNKLLDSPNIIENSKDYYYEKAIYEMLNNEYFTNYELYQTLLILGQQKKIFDIKNITDKIKIYKSKNDNKKYTKKTNF